MSDKPLADALATEFRTNEHGIIIQPGKFEGEPLFTPYFYEQGLNGVADEDLDDNGWLFNVTDVDRTNFPGLASVIAVKIYVRDDGFVFHETLKADDLEP